MAGDSGRQGRASLLRMARIVAWPLRFFWYNFFIWFMVPLRIPLSPGLSFEIVEDERFVVRDPFRARVLTHWKAPYTGGFTCVLPSGTQLVALANAPAGSKQIPFVPRSQAAFTRAQVPAPVRRHPKFDSVSLVLNAGQVEAHLARDNHPRYRPPDAHRG